MYGITAYYGKPEPFLQALRSCWAG